MKYFGDVYRPPSEARSLIIQATVGCANNTCTFCKMYQKDQFKIRKVEDVLKDLEEMKEEVPLVRRIFIADGDALVLKTDYWLKILDYIYENFPNIERVTSYATALDINRKSDEDLALLRKRGLNMLYIGFESGDDRVLEEVGKNMTKEDYIEAMERAKKAGFQTSVTLIAGLTDEEEIKKNALETADLITKTKPDYLAYLTLNLEEGSKMFEDMKAGKFKLHTAEEILFEIKCFLENVDSQGTIFRANHASNYINLKGTLNQDRESLIKTIDDHLKTRDFKPEKYRML